MAKPGGRGALGSAQAHYATRSASARTIAEADAGFAFAEALWIREWMEREVRDRLETIETQLEKVLALHLVSPLRMRRGQRNFPAQPLEVVTAPGAGVAATASTSAASLGSPREAPTAERVCHGPAPRTPMRPTAFMEDPGPDPPSPAVEHRQANAGSGVVGGGVGLAAPGAEAVVTQPDSEDRSFEPQVSPRFLSETSEVPAYRGAFRNQGSRLSESLAAVEARQQALRGNSRIFDGLADAGPTSPPKTPAGPALLRQGSRTQSPPEAIGIFRHSWTTELGMLPSEASNGTIVRARSVRSTRMPSERNALGLPPRERIPADGGNENPTPTPSSAEGAEEKFEDYSLDRANGKQRSSGRIGSAVKAARRRNIVQLSAQLYQKQASRSKALEFVYKFLEEPDSSIAAYIYEKVWMLTILLTVAATLVAVLDRPPISSSTAAWVEVSIESFFFIEAFTRFAATPAKLAYFHNIYNLIDIASVLPLALRAAVGFVVDIHHKDRESVSLAFLMGWVPMVRLLKVLRRFEKFHLLVRAFHLAIEAMPVILFIYGSLLLTFSTLVYLAEPSSNIADMPEAMWLTAEAMTTVGFGDVYPVSTLGRLLVGSAVFAATLHMAIPLGIIGNAFSDVWADRDRILLAEKTRAKLISNGFKVQDVERFVHLFDKDGNGMLEFDEFEDMISEMSLGLSGDRIVDLFQLADKDGSGDVDPKELLKTLFPYYALHSEEERLQMARSMSRMRLRTSVGSAEAQDTTSSTTQSKAETAPSERKERTYGRRSLGHHHNHGLQR